MVYENDPSAIKDAEDELDNLEYQAQIDALDKMIDKLNEYKDLWDELPETYEKAQRALVAADLWGPDWQDRVLNMDTSLLADFTPDYEDTEQKMRDAAVMAAAAAVQDAAETVKSLYEAGDTDDPQAKYIVFDAATGTQMSDKQMSLEEAKTYVQELQALGEDYAQVSFMDADEWENLTKHVTKCLNAEAAELRLVAQFSSEATEAVSGDDGLTEAFTGEDGVNDAISTADKEWGEFTGKITASEEEVAECIYNAMGGFSEAEASMENILKYWDQLSSYGLLQNANKNMSAQELTDRIWGAFNDLYLTKYVSPNYRGTAYADGKLSGDWSAGSKGTDGLSLVGELGPEVRVRDGQYEVLGASGAEFTDVKKDDIIFNHKQSAQLLKNGHINSRGKAFAEGKFTPLSNLSGGNFDLYKSLNIISDNVPKISTNLNTLVQRIESPATSSAANSAPTITVNNPTFTCTGVTGEEVLRQIERSFSGIFTNAYQQVTK